VRHYDRELAVECLRGYVQVTDREGSVDLFAGHRLPLALPQQTALRAEPLSPEKSRELEAALVMPMLPVWGGPPALWSESSTLEIAAAAGRPVLVDGMAVGTGSLGVRVMSGRHHLRVLGAGQDWEDGRWISLAAGARRSEKVGADSELNGRTR
jgi:hypothetical protein